MFYEGNVSIQAIRGVNMWLAPGIIAKGKALGVDVWYDNISFTDTGEVDLFAASQEEEYMIDFMCWLQNTYAFEQAAA